MFTCRFLKIKHLHLFKQFIFYFHMYLQFFLCWCVSLTSLERLHHSVIVCQHKWHNAGTPQCLCKNANASFQKKPSYLRSMGLEVLWLWLLANRQSWNTICSKSWPKPVVRWTRGLISWWALTWSMAPVTSYFKHTSNRKLRCSCPIKTESHKSGKFSSEKLKTNRVYFFGPKWKVVDAPSNICM